MADAGEIQAWKAGMRIAQHGNAGLAYWKNAELRRSGTQPKRYLGSSFRCNAWVHRK
jgi:hypothetical protein